MKISELSKLIPIDKDPEINHMDAIEDYFFNKRGSDYRESAINFAIKHDLPILTTANNAYELMEKFVRLICPKCGNTLKGNGGGGCNDIHTINFKCECGTSANLSITVPGGLNFKFKEE